MGVRARLQRELAQRKAAQQRTAASARVYSARSGTLAINVAATAASFSASSTGRASSPGLLHAAPSRALRPKTFRERRLQDAPSRKFSSR